MKLRFSLLFILLLLAGSSSFAKYNLRFICSQSDTNFYVKIQIQADTAFKMGGANLVFTFNTLALQIWCNTNDTVPGCTWYNFYTGLYAGNSVKKPSANRVSVNIVWNGTTGNGEDVPVGTWKDVAQVRFHALSSTLASNLTWRLITPNQTIITNDNSTAPATMIRGTLTNSTHTAPVELVSFDAHAEVGKVDLIWKTATEVNNEGFDVLRCAKVPSNPDDLEGWTKLGFVQGHGNSSLPNEYRYVDNNIPDQGELFYRLLQVDRDGSSQYSQIVRVALGTAGKFQVYQPYPNPFTTSTALSFSIPAEQHVRVEIFDSAGQLISSLLDDVIPAGFHTVSFNASDMAPGVYRYTIMAGSVVKHGKMVLSR